MWLNNSPGGASVDRARYLAIGHWLHHTALCKQEKNRHRTVQGSTNTLEFINLSNKTSANRSMQSTELWTQLGWTSGPLQQKWDLTSPALTFQRKGSAWGQPGLMEYFAGVMIKINEPCDGTYTPSRPFPPQNFPPLLFINPASLRLINI